MLASGVAWCDCGSFRRVHEESLKCVGLRSANVSLGLNQCAHGLQGDPGRQSGGWYGSDKVSARHSVHGGRQSNMRVTARRLAQ